MSVFGLNRRRVCAGGRCRVSRLAWSHGDSQVQSRSIRTRDFIRFIWCERTRRCETLERISVAPSSPDGSCLFPAYQRSDSPVEVRPSGLFLAALRVFQPEAAQALRLHMFNSLTRKSFLLCEPGCRVKYCRRFVITSLWFIFSLIPVNNVVG